MSKEKLCKKFLAKNWIHETNEINKVEVSNALTSDLKALDQFLSQFQLATHNIKSPVDAQSEKKEVITKLETIPDAFKEASKKKPFISMNNFLNELQNFMEKLKAESSEPYGISGSSNT